MLPRHDTVPSALVPDLIVCLDQLRQFVNRRALAGCSRGWSEVVRTFSDDRGFLDFSARRHGGRPRVLIEFGVHDETDRHVSGFFDAFWDGVNGDFLRIEAIVLDGQSVQLDQVALHLTPYLNLPRTSDEVVELAEVA